MAKLGDLEVGDIVTVVARSNQRDPFTGQATTQTTNVRGTVAAVDRSGLTIISGETGKPHTVPADAVVDIAFEGMVYRWLDPKSQPVLVRVYPGGNQVEAAMSYADEAVRLARVGYLPVAQSWAVGEPGLGRVLALGTLGAVALRPQGAMIVTYVHRSASRDPDAR